MRWGGAMRWAAGDPALPISNPRVVDMSGSPGDFAVESYVRIIKCRIATGMSELLITHPAITAMSAIVGSWEGNATLTPEATKRDNIRPLAGGIVVGLSSGAIATDGPFTLAIVAL